MPEQVALVDEQEQVSNEKELIREMDSMTHDPLAWVHYVFPWDEPDGPLAEYAGPDVWQTQVLEYITARLKKKEITATEAVSTVLRISIAAGNGPGKAQPKDLLIYTPLGYRRFGDLRAGDYVYGKDGKPTRILQIHDRGILPTYKVVFDDGSSTITCADHVWTVRGHLQRRKDRKGGPSLQWINKTTIELISLLRKKNGNGNGYRQWEIPAQGTCEIAKKDIPIHPYILGLWLGDGNKARITTADKDIIEKCKELNGSISLGTKQKTDAKSVYLHKIQKPLRQLGLYNKLSYDKFIPDIYKNNDISVRLSILQGLIDTDGCIDKDDGTVEFCVTSFRLCEDVIWLVRSLGGKAWIKNKPKDTWYYGKNKQKIPCRIAYRVHIRMPNGMECCILKRKRDRLKPITQDRYLHRWIDSIELLTPQDCMCISVENKDGLYLTNDFIVTHNSALVAWLILWAMSTFEDTRGVVTANTDTQLRTKTWAELAKWYHMCITRHWFHLTATAIYSKDKQHERTWRIDQVPWSEEKTEAFAGLHNKGKRILLIFDEASAIPDTIWDVAQGALTDKKTEIIWVVSGNPTRNKGRFRECWGKFRHRWKGWQIDIRKSILVNQTEVNQWIEDLGLDSDWVKVHILGKFPSAGDLQFIGTAIAEKAAAVKLTQQQYFYAPKIITVDSAWTGGDETGIGMRQGLAFTVLQVFAKNDDDGAIADAVARHEDEQNADAVFIDQGYGTGIYSFGKRLNRQWILVNFGSKSPTLECFNKRADMWNKAKQWLIDGGSIPNNQRMIDDLTGPEKKDNIRQTIQLESKKEMRQRGLASPTRGDLLALSFAMPVTKKRRNAMGQTVQEFAVGTDYNPLVAKS